MKLVPKPELLKLVDAIHELTQLAGDILGHHDAETIRHVIARAVERGVELQREAVIGDSDEMDTPLLPPPSDAPLPHPGRLPVGVGNDDKDDTKRWRRPR